MSIQAPEKAARQRQSVLQLAQTLGSVSDARRQRGITRTRYMTDITLRQVKATEAPSLRACTATEWPIRRVKRLLLSRLCMLMRL